MHIAFRHVADAEPAWQYYGLDLPVVGGADTLARAQTLAADAAEFALDGPITLVSVLEWQAVPAQGDAPAVYVRVLRSADARWTQRSEFAQWLRERISADPGRCTAFADQPSSTGDIVTCAVLADDPVSQALAQTSAHGTVHFAMPAADGVCWLPITGPEADEQAPEARPLRDLDLPRGATMSDLMDRVDSAGAPTRTLTLA